MGLMVIAKCECGLETDLVIGGGSIKSVETCYFPCLCENCQNIVMVNLLADEPRCPECNAPDPIPYDDPGLSDFPGDDVIASWNMEDRLGRDLILTNGKYKCPSCGNMSLEFIEYGLCWD